MTGYVEYATPVYETPHVYFLLKPVQAEQLYAALGKALERLASQTGAYLPVTCGGAVRRLPVGKIIYLESNRRKVIVHMVDDTVETYAKLSDFEDQLPPNFVRSHMSFLVNMNYLEWVDGKTATLSTGIQLPVSRQRSVATREAFHRHLQRVFVGPSTSSPGDGRAATGVEDHPRTGVRMMAPSGSRWAGA